MKFVAAWFRAKVSFGWRVKVRRERFAGKDYCVIVLRGVRYGIGKDWAEAFDDARLNWPDALPE